MSEYKTRYPKHFIIIRDKVFNIGDDITIEEDLSEIYNTASLNIPHFETSQWSTKDLKKYDRVQIYYGEFDTAAQRERARISDCTRIFDGYIDSTPLSESKTAGINWNGIGLKSTLALLFERTAITPIYASDIYTILSRGLEETSIVDWIDYFEVDSGIQPSFIANIQGDKYFGEVLNQIKEKYAIQIYQKSDSGMRIQLPSSFNVLGKTFTRYNSNGRVESVKDQSEAFVFDLKTNCFSVDYGDMTQRVDTVVVKGLNCVGVAFDPIAYQLKNGVSVENIKNNVTPVKDNINPYYIFRRDLLSEEDCQLVAQEKLVDIAKNYGIKINVMYDSRVKLGDRFIIRNSEKISEQQIWIIKKRSISLSKTGAIKCSISAYSCSVGDIPANYLIGSSGLLDTDILNLTDRVVSTMELIR